jgi:oxygen-independent coproporphyrinogen-3 oxidase
MVAIPIRLRGETLPVTTELLDRYNVQGPRYTSYPTAPEWTEDVGPAEYRAAAERANASGAPVSLYVHLPFCDEQCWFCGCFMKVVPKPERKGQGREEIAGYLGDVHKEIDRLAGEVDRGRPVVQAHWGGGTPTYLTPAQAGELAHHLFSAFTLAPGAEVSVEVDPRVTTPEHLETLFKAGFNRVSMGVQDFDPTVQELVNRIQPFEMTRDLVAAARSIGYESVNLDLIYGLPGQRLEGFEESIQKILSLRPDRLALYSYAHVPWPVAEARPRGRTSPRAPRSSASSWRVPRFVEAGYEYIGMHHFALPTTRSSRPRRTARSRATSRATRRMGCDSTARRWPSQSTTRTSRTATTAPRRGRGRHVHDPGRCSPRTTSLPP